MTLIELMVALLLGLLVAGAAVGTFLASSQMARSMRGAAVVNDGGQSVVGYLSQQLRSAGHLDLMGQEGQWGLLQQMDDQPAPSTGDGSALSLSVASTYPGLFALHGCNQAYTSASQLLNYSCAAGGSNLAASVTVAYQVLTSPNGWLAPSLISALNVNRGFQTDCGGRGTRASDSPSASPSGDAVVNRYYLDVSNRRLMCVGNGNPAQPVQIAADIEQFQVLYGVAQADMSNGEMLKNYLTADEVNALVNGWPNVVAVQVCALAVAEPGSAAAASTNVFNVDCAGRPVESRDGRLRRAHRAIINLRAASRSATSLR
ncbi:PilW family protein [Ideonella paludis]|uniref:PilW family protein n=2 Tax=Ideonella paludis TaxID=1233411 RepID=A0ABS5DX57_9BURK|nr:PilW family protein [Ideonella paludis]